MEGPGRRAAVRDPVLADPRRQRQSSSASSFFKDDERALTNYFHLFEILLEEARGTGWALADLVTTLDGYIKETRQPPVEDGNVQRLESDRAAVQVMTIHKSKGLEAAVVFLCGGFTSAGPTVYTSITMATSACSTSTRRTNGKKSPKRERAEEEQRLYYVALTRAKARLYLPLVPQQHWSSYWKGGYRRVNQRLAARAGAAGGRRTLRDPDVPRRASGPGS